MARTPPAEEVSRSMRRLLAMLLGQSPTVRRSVVGPRWLTEAFKGLRVCAGLISPRDDDARDDLDHTRVMAAEPKVDFITQVQAHRTQQLCRDSYLPYLGDLVRAIRRGHVMILIIFVI